MISADLTRELLERRYGQKEMSSWKDKKENTSENRAKNKQMAIDNTIEPIYDFDKDVLDIADLDISKDSIKTSTGFDYKLESDLKGKDY
jgi:hypothetical protein